MCRNSNLCALEGVARLWLLLGSSVGHSQYQGNRPAIPTPGLAWIQDCVLKLEIEPEQVGEKKTTHLEITEIYFQTPKSTPNSEFLERVYNGKNTLDVSGWRLDKDVKFIFTDNTIMQPGKPVLVVRDATAFARAFKTDGTVRGAFDGGLKRRGERLCIVDANDKTITDVHYATAAPWPVAVADGSDSLQRI